MQDIRRQSRHKRWSGHWLVVGLSGFLQWGLGWLSLFDFIKECSEW